MDIAFVIADLGVRGAVRRVVELSNHLIKRGHIATVYTRTGAPCEWLPLRAGVFKWSHIGHHEAIICCGGGPDGQRALRAANAPCKAVYVLGIGYARDAMTETLRRNSTSFARLVNDGVGLLANCTRIAEYFQGQGHDCAVVFGGVDFDTFHPWPSKEPWRILFAGTKARKDGTPDALEVMELLESIYPLLERKAYAGRGFSQIELSQVYSSAICFLDCHYGGGWSNCVAEAMACGTAVVCTDIDGVQDFAFQEKTALLVRPGDTWGMAKSIHRLIREPGLRKRLVRNAQQTITKFTWDRAAGQLETWLEGEA